MAYDSDKKPSGLSVLTALDDTDTVIVGDTSDTIEVVKTISWSNVKTAITTLIEGLSSYFNVTSDDSDAITEGVTNLFLTTSERTKLTNIEALADVTDTTNVTAAGALMDSEVTNLAAVKAFDPTDYATAAQGTTADSALQDVVDDTTPQLGGDLDAQGNNVTNLGDVTFQTGVAGGTLRTGTSAADKFVLQAYDVNGTAYQTVVELDAGDDPVLQLRADFLEIDDETDNTKRVTWDVSGATTGTATDLAFAQTANRTITFPNATDTLVGKATTDTLTNKTIDGDNNTISNLDIGNEVDWAAATDVSDASAFTSGDKVLIFEAGVGLRKVDYDDLPSGGGGLANVVEDTTPQLGGQLDVNGNAIGDGTLELLTFTETASAVNQVNITNAATGNGPTISAAGDDTNIDLVLQAKGSGDVQLSSSNLDLAGNSIESNSFPVHVQTNTGLQILSFNTVASAVNEVTLVNAATGNGPEIQATGNDTNIDIELVPKGSGRVKDGGTNVQLELAEGAFVDGDKTKLDGIETSADVTDTANVTSAGALMDSELTDIAAVKALADADVSTTNTGTSTTAFVTPDGLAGSYAGTKSIGIMVTDGSGAITTGDGKAYFRVPAAMNGMNITAVAASLTAPSTSGTPTIQIARGRQAAAGSAHAFVDVLSTAITIDANEYDSKDATTAAVINASNDDLATGDLIRVDVDGVGSGPTAVLSVNFEAQLP